MNRSLILALVATMNIGLALSSILPIYRYEDVSSNDDGSVNPSGNGDRVYKPRDSVEEPPVVEIRLLKGHVSPQDEKWAFSSEYVYSSKEYPRKDMESEGNTGKMIETSKDQQQTVDPKIIPQIGSRNIITAPSYCPKGERRDRAGHCRKVINNIPQG